MTKLWVVCARLIVSLNERPTFTLSSQEFAICCVATVQNTLSFEGIERKDRHMTPIKLNDFLHQTAPQVDKSIMDLGKLGLQHAAPQEDGKMMLTLRFDAKTGTLMPTAAG